MNAKIRSLDKRKIPIMTNGGIIEVDAIDTVEEAYHLLAGSTRLNSAREHLLPQEDWYRLVAFLKRKAKEEDGSWQRG